MRLQLKKEKLLLLILIIIIIILFQCTSFSSDKHNASNDELKEINMGGKPNSMDDLTMLITQGENDIVIIPDKYNTGVNPSIPLYKITESTTYQDIVYTNNGISIVLDLYYKNNELGELTVIENIDFSETPFAVYNDAKVDTKKTILFRNCKFSIMSTNPKATNVFYQFENCSFANYNGSNADFKKCYFGGTSTDGINPYKNVTVEDCYFSDFAYIQYDKIVHSDGIQIYGYEQQDATNIHLKNCRFEIPIIPLANSTSAINSCIFVDLEFSNGNNITFTDCIANGGAFTLNVIVKSNFTVSNVNFKNIKVGAARKFGILYPDSEKLATFENVQETSKLYIASVWKENGTLHLSVTNDTSSDKKLIIVTQNGTSEYLVPGCYESSKLTVENNLTFQDYPFDKEYILADSDWVVCYDTSIKEENQIRFVNWGNAPVYIPIPENPDSNLQTGSCGKSISFALKRNGELLLNGTGETDQYYSTKKAPWSSYLDKISSIILENGITGIGSALFSDCSKVGTISIPNGITKIEGNAFIRCTSLKSISLPNSILQIGNYAFAKTSLTDIFYDGSKIDWTKIIIGNYNDPLYSAKLHTNEKTILTKGMCGENITWTLFSDGLLDLTGAGATFSYHSNKPVPYQNNLTFINKISISKGITTLGSELFRRCINVNSAVIPEGVTTIEGNVFTNCSSLQSIYLPVSLKSIGNYAFSATALTDVYYTGDYKAFQTINIGTFNNPLLNATCHYLIS